MMTYTLQERLTDYPLTYDEPIIMTEDEIRELAIYYYDNSDVIDEIDFEKIENCLAFIRRVDLVEPIANEEEGATK